MITQVFESWLDVDLEEHIFFNLDTEINKIVTPLIEYFGLDSFNFLKTYNDGSQIRFTNKPKWQRHFLENKLYQQSIFELPAGNYSRDRVIWSNVATHKTILEEAAKFEIKNGITLVEPAPDGCEFYFLGTTSSDSLIVNKYLNNFYLLEKFITNFHSFGREIFAKAEPHKLVINDRKENKLTFTSSHNIDKFSFLSSVYSYKFTQRELDCIPLLLKGLSSKQIAEYLQISFRTVEVYIDHLKYKTNTTTKGELLFLLSERFA